MFGRLSLNLSNYKSIMASYYTSNPQSVLRKSLNRSMEEFEQDHVISEIRAESTFGRLSMTGGKYPFPLISLID